MQINCPLNTVIFLKFGGNLKLPILPNWIPLSC